jgi:hypothetical protein
MRLPETSTYQMTWAFNLGRPLLIRLVYLLMIRLFGMARTLA